MRHLFIGVAVTAIVSLPVAVLGASAPMVRGEFGIGEAGFGFLIAIFFLSGALASLPAGFIAHAIGLRAMVLGSCGAAVLALFVIPSFVSAWWPLAVCLFGAGIANSTGQVAVNQWLARYQPVDRQGVAFGAKQAAVPLATLSAGFLLPLVAVPHGWRAGFWTAMTFAVVGLLAIWWATGRRHPGPETPTRSHSWRTDRVAVMLALIGFLGACGGTSLAPFLVDYATSRGVSIEIAGLLLALGSASGVAARVLVGVAADRLRLHPVSMIGALLGAGTVGIGLLALGAEGAIWVPAVTLGFAGAWGWAGLLPFALARMSADGFRSGVGLVVMGQLVGAVVGPAMFGVLVQTAGYAIAWTVLLGFVATAGLLAVATKRIHGRPETIR